MRVKIRVRVSLTREKVNKAITGTMSLGWGCLSQGIGLESRHFPPEVGQIKEDGGRLADNVRKLCS